MPKLIENMKIDLSKKEFQFTRDFFLLSNKWAFSPSESCLLYYLEDHDDLQDKITILENRGYVIDITPKKTKKYRMTEEFVEFVLKEG